MSCCNRRAAAEDDGVLAAHTVGTLPSGRAPEAARRVQECGEALLTALDEVAKHVRAPGAGRQRKPIQADLERALRDGGIAADGDAGEILTPEQLGAVYGAAFELAETPAGRRVVVPNWWDRDSSQ